MKRIAVLITFALLLGLASAAYAKKGGGGKPGGGGDPGNTTPLDILISDPAGSGYGTLYALQDDGTGMTELADTRGYHTWSPDGTRVAFYAVLGDGFGVYLMDVDGGTPAQLISIPNFTAGWLDWCPVVENGGVHRLAFTQHDPVSGYVDVFVARFDGTGVLDVENVTNTPGAEEHPTWSPDGLRIALEYYDDIRVLDLDQRDPSGAPSMHVVYESQRFDPNYPAWSRTGSQIAFQAIDGDTGDLPDLFVLEVTQAPDGSWSGGSAVNLTNTPDDGENNPSWSPDDARLLYGNGHWRANRKGSAKSSLQLLTLATGAREVLLDSGYAHPVWKRSSP